MLENVTNAEPYLIALAESGMEIVEQAVEEGEIFDCAEWCLMMTCVVVLDEELAKCRSTLMTILFKNLSDIGRFKDARLAIMGNPDVDR